MSNHEHNQNASEAALEFLKHLLTLASGVLVLSGTFVTKVDSISSLALCFLFASWASQIVCLFCALNAISAIIMSRVKNSNDWQDGAAKTLSSIGKWAFFTGLILFAVFAALALNSESSTTETDSQGDDVMIQQFHQSAPTQSDTVSRQRDSIPEASK